MGQENFARRIWKKVRQFLERFAIIILAVAIIVIWIFQAFVPLIDFEVALGGFISLLAMMLWLIAGLIKEAEQKTGASFHKDQGEGNSEIVSFIKAEGPQESEKPGVAELIEYSSYTVEPILSELAKCGWKINLLIFNPRSDEVISPIQKEQRICLMISRLRLTTLKQHERVEIRCYDKPASIRGRKLANKMIQIGWYTHEVRKDQVELFGTSQIWGHDNPLVTASLATQEGRHMEVMFDRVWQYLWGDDGSISISEVCNDCDRKSTCLGATADKWLNRVSPR